jgi:hypothetical protein
VYENWKSNQGRYEKAKEGISYFERMASRAAPITMEQMKASATVQGIADLRSQNPKMSKAEATGIYLGTSGWSELQRAFSEFGQLPRTEEELNQINDEALEIIGQTMWKDPDFVGPEVVRQAYLDGLKSMGFIQERYTGLGGQKEPAIIPGADNEMSDQDFSTNMAREINPMAIPNV